MLDRAKDVGSRSAFDWDVVFRVQVLFPFERSSFQAIDQERTISPRRATFSPRMMYSPLEASVKVIGEPGPKMRSIASDSTRLASGAEC